MDMEPETIFNVAPPADGKSTLVLLLCMNMSLGAVLMQFFSHLRYDYHLILKPGWTQPAKLVSRVAYFMCRLLPLAATSTFIMWVSLKNQDCAAMLTTVYTLAMFIFDAVVLIFVQRTMALYAWKRSVVIPLAAYYLSLLLVGAIAVPAWGVGLRIPGTAFCTANARRHETRTIVWNVVYKTLSMGLDLVLLLLTLHRLLEGGLRSTFSSQKGHGLRGQGISSLLIRQGFHFYVLQFASDVFLISSYFGFKDDSYSGLGLPLVFAVPPIAAAAAFRDVGQKASTLLTNKPERINEIMSSDDTPSRGGLSSKPGASAVHPGRTTRIMWGSKVSPHHDRPDLDTRGIRVTVGTVSRTDHADRAHDEWRGNDSVEADRDDIEMQRQLPKLTIDGRAVSDTGRASLDAKSDKS